MRNVLMFALLIGAGFAVAGFFAHGMARLSGITPATSGGARADTRKPAEARKASEDAAAKTAAAGATPLSAAGSASVAVPASDVSPIDDAPLPSEVIESSPVVSEVKAAAEKTTPVQSPTIQSTATRAASARPVASPLPKTVLVIPPSLSTAEAREAQCRSLSAYLSELDSIARTRSEPGVQSWVQHQRTTTWERQTELRC